jgi:poly-beta-1,6-N-acetyl-D-glucosamine synthase
MVLFWVMFFFILYTYVGYPLLLWLVPRFKRLGVCKTVFKPRVSIVLAVLNEESRIGARLENLLQQGYPPGKLEIIVVSDGSTDCTCAVVRSFGENGVKLVELASRQGKAVALNQGVALATGEIIVFADARQRFELDAVANLVANFSDPMVGCVSGELVLLSDSESQIKAEMGAYWRYEKWIRKMESLTGSVVGATGAIYAIRRELFRSLPAMTILDDVLTPLNVVCQGYRCLFDGRSVAYDTISLDAAQEWHRKVRTLAGNWQLLSLCPALLVPWLNPCWWRFLSHKIMRLIVPFALLLLFASGMMLHGGFYMAATAAQLLFYGMALAGCRVPAVRRVRIASFCYFFLVMNAAAVSGFWLWITGRSGAAWKLKST